MAEEHAAAIPLPAGAAVDINALHDALKAGEAGEKALEQALVMETVALSADEVIARDAADAAEAAAALAANGGFAFAHVGGGNFEITGPGIDEPEKVKGKAAAEARIAELAAAASNPPADPPTE